MGAALSLSPAASAALAGISKDPKAAIAAKAHAAAQDFEAVFLNTMVSQMFTAIGNEGPLGSGEGASVWRSFLADEYSKSFAKAGGVGIASHVYDSLLAQQEAQVRR
jgi:Rod binding domain-containing protein